MERNLCRVTKVQKIEPIKDKDRIVLATIDNFPVIVEKEKFKVGDLVIFCEYDTILPIREEFEFLRPRCYSKAYNGFRIQNMKMAGVYSSGIAFPISLVDEQYHKLGTDLTDVLNIRKYDPEELKEFQSALPKKKTLRRRLIGYSWFRWLMRFNWFIKFIDAIIPNIRYTYPLTVVKSGETNIEKCFDTLPKDKLYYCSEKIEGQAGCWLLNKRTYMMFSHNMYRSPRDAHVWGEISSRLNLEKILRKHARKTGEHLAIQGEIVGPGIQSNIYGFDTHKLFIYKITNVDTGQAYNYKELIDFCDRHLLATVPILAHNRPLLDTVEDMLADCEGNSVLKNKGKSIKREGVVWRAMDDQSIGCKCKSRDYQAWFATKDKTI